MACHGAFGADLSKSFSKKVLEIVLEAEILAPLEVLDFGKNKTPKALASLGFQRFLSSDIFDYFAVMSDFGERLENRLPLRARGFESPILRQNKEAFTKVSAFFVLHKMIFGDSNAVKKQHSKVFLCR